MELKNKTLEELKEIRNELATAWVIQKSEYQTEKLKEVNKEIQKRLERNK
jgi:hypothetical protein